MSRFIELDYMGLRFVLPRKREEVNWDESKHARDHGKFASKPGAKGNEKGKPHTAAQEAHARKQIARTEGMSHHQASKILGEYADLHRDTGKHGLAQIYAEASAQRMQQHYDLMLARKRARWDDDDPAFGRPTKPEERHPDKELSRGEIKPPPQPGTGNPSGLSKTAMGDLVEAALVKLNLRPVMPPGQRQNPLDAEADHSGQAFEIKACTTAAQEFKAKPKKDEVEAKRKYAAEHGLKPATMIAVVDYENKQVHAYWRDGIGAYSLTQANHEEWNFAGTVDFSETDVKLWDRGSKKKAKRGEQ